MKAMQATEINNDELSQMYLSAKEDFRRARNVLDSPQTKRPYAPGQHNHCQKVWQTMTRRSSVRWSRF